MSSSTVSAPATPTHSPEARRRFRRRRAIFTAAAAAFALGGFVRLGADDAHVAFQMPEPVRPDGMNEGETQFADTRAADDHELPSAADELLSAQLSR